MLGCAGLVAAAPNLVVVAVAYGAVLLANGDGLDEVLEAAPSGCRRMGAAYLDSLPGRGTTVTVELPLSGPKR